MAAWPRLPDTDPSRRFEPQLVGGADITQELAESGELKTLLETKLGAGYADGAEERTVDVMT